MSRNSTSHKAHHRFARSISFEQCGRLSAVRWFAVHFRSCRSIDWNVSLQIQIDATDSNVQRFEAFGLLSIQHGKFHRHIFDLN